MTPAVPGPALAASDARGSSPTLLLCPPGTRIYQRDNYCSHESKASYYWYPYDLVVRSGFLSGIGPVEVLDATARRLTARQALDILSGTRYRAVLALTGAVCWGEDEEFLRRLDQQAGVPVYLSGDVVCAHPKRAMEELPFVAGVLRDYTSPALAQHLEGRPPEDGALVLRGQEVVPPRAARPGAPYLIPIPRWDLFPPGYYRLPFLRSPPFASVGASFGCPHACGFCTAAPLAWKMRDLDNLFDELRFLKRAGYREIHFKDLSFGIDPASYGRLLERLVDERLGFVFCCLARADNLSPDLLRLMKRAGCRLVHMGVESASGSTLERVGKGLTLGDVETAIEDCRRLGIAVLASYVLGLPWETRQDLERSIELAISLDTDYASFNTYLMRTNWPTRGAGSAPVARDYDLDEMVHLAYRRFYFRPAYLLRRLIGSASPTTLRLAVASGWELFRRHVLPGMRNGRAGSTT